MPTDKQVKAVADTIMEMDKPVRLQEELERAYRCICGFHTFARNGKLPDEGMLAYHSPVIGAARRFVIEEKLDGAKYFEGKPIAVLHAALKL